MISPVRTPPGKTAWDLMLAAPIPSGKASPASTHGEITPRPSQAGVEELAETGDDADLWALHHLTDEYFAPIVEGCRHSGIWPLRTVWTGVTGNPYPEKGKGGRIDPNWVVEDARGERYTRTGGFDKPHFYNASRMRAWPYEQIAEYFGFEPD